MTLLRIRPRIAEQPDTSHAPEPVQDAAPAPVALPARPGHTITLRGLRSFYGDLEAVKGVDLDFAANKITAAGGTVTTL